MCSEHDEPPIAISSLQHWAYCARQCSLIHVEQVFDENVHTLRGRADHSRVDQPAVEARIGLLVERSLPLWSERFRLIGKADLVEFEPDGAPFPVEYKHGLRRKSPRIAACDDLQLAAQALCLEEMTGLAVPAGAIFYASSKRRRVVAIDAPLRAAVLDAIEGVRALLRGGQLPAPVNDERCRACSLIDICQPRLKDAKMSEAETKAYLFDLEP